MIDKQIQNKKQKYADVKGGEAMTDEVIIKNWRMGLTVKSIAKKIQRGRKQKKNTNRRK